MLDVGEGAIGRQYKEYLKKSRTFEFFYQTHFSILIKGVLMIYKKIVVTLLLSSGLMMACTSEAKLQSHRNTQQELSIFTDIQKSNLSAVEKYIHENKDIELKNHRDETLLMYAIYQKKWNIAKQLIQAGADVNAQDQSQNSPFLYAGAEGYLEIVKLALAHQADFKRYNRYGGTALIPAAEKGHIETVRLLANMPNFPINHVNRLGWTALMEAVVLSDGGPAHIEIIKILLEAGADKDIPDKNGISALQHAKRQGFTEIVQLLQ